MAETNDRPTVKITTPTGETRTIQVRLSTLIELEEQLGAPVLLRAQQGYAGPSLRIAYRVGQDAGIIPADVTFADFVDDDDWKVDFAPVESPVVDDEGNG